MSKELFYKAICEASVYRASMWRHDGVVGDSRLPKNLVELANEMVGAIKVIDTLFSETVVKSISEPELSEKPCFGEDSANGSPTHDTK